MANSIETMQFSNILYFHGIYFCLFWDNKLVLTEVWLVKRFKQNEVERGQNNDIDEYGIFLDLESKISAFV